MTHFHYDRFDTPDDEQDGKWSVNFRTNPQGDIEEAVMSLDEAEAVFTRKPETLDPKLLGQLAGSYETPTGTKIQVTYQEKSGLSLVSPGAPPMPLNQVKGLRFRTPRFSDAIFEFVVENGQVKALKEQDPSGVFSFPKKKGMDPQFLEGPDLATMPADSSMVRNWLAATPPSFCLTPLGHSISIACTSGSLPSPNVSARSLCEQ